MGNERLTGQLGNVLLDRCRSAVSAHRRRAKDDGQRIDYDAADLAALDVLARLRAGGASRYGH